MITTFKTKEKVIVNSRLGEKDYVYLDVRGLYFDGKKYKGDVVYYYVADGEYRTLEIVNPEFTVEEAALIEQAGNPLTGNTTERLIQLVIQATLFQVSQQNYYGLTAADWEMTFPPSETPVEPVIEPPTE
jgi:hypothetical protein